MHKSAESFAVGAIDFTGGSLGKLFISGILKSASVNNKIHIFFPQEKYA